MKAKKTRTRTMWIAADAYDYDFFPGRKNPVGADADGIYPDIDPTHSMCRDGFRRIFGGLGLKPFGPAKRFTITITEVE